MYRKEQLRRRLPSIPENDIESFRVPTPTVVVEQVDETIRDHDSNIEEASDDVTKEDAVIPKDDAEEQIPPAVESDKDKVITDEPHPFGVQPAPQPVVPTRAPPAVITRPRKPIDRTPLPNYTEMRRQLRESIPPPRNCCAAWIRNHYQVYDATGPAIALSLVGFILFAFCICYFCMLTYKAKSLCSFW